MDTPAPLPRIGAPATRALQEAGIHSLDDLNAVDLNQLANSHGVGPKAVQLLRAALDRS
jgi:predicted RecB family nuclease